MIVEDSLPFRNLIKGALLPQFPSMEIIEAESGEEALIRSASIPVDLVFMDIGLPGQNGLEVTRKIKADRPDTPIIVLTSYDLPEYREAALQYGANGFVVKESLNWGEISTLVECCEKAKVNGRKPFCIRLQTGCAFATPGHIAS